MFDFLKSRKERHGFTVYLIFGTIIFVFVFWGFKTVDGPSAGYAAQVNHEIVTVGEFKRAFDRQMQFFSQFMGNQMEPKGERLTRMKQEILESLIGSKLLSQAAEKNGFQATDVELRDQIYSIPAFQQDGRFDRNIYKAYLEQTRMSTSEFENGLRESARLNAARELITSVLKPTLLEAKKLYKIQNTKLNIDFVQFDSADPKWITEKDVQSFLADPNSQNKLTQSYEKKKGQFAEGEQVHASHILVKTEPGKEADAEKKVKEIAEKAKTEDFGTLAQKYSDDPGSKNSKGDLGFFGRGRMVEEFEKVAFTLEPGKVSAPVKTPFGFHIIKVLAKKPGHTKELPEVRTQLARELLVEEKSSKLAQSLENALREKNTDAVNKIVASSNLKWENTGLFDLSAQSVPKVGMVPGFQDAVAGLSKDKPLPTELIRFGTKTFVARFKDSQSAKAEPSATELTTVSQQAANSRLSETFDQWQEKLSKSSTIKRNDMVLGEF